MQMDGAKLSARRCDPVWSCFYNERMTENDEVTGHLYRWLSYTSINMMLQMISDNGDRPVYNITLLLLLLIITITIM